MLEEGSTAGSSCWVGALSQLPEADCPSRDSELFSFSVCISLLSVYWHPFIETWKMCREVCLTCSRQSGRQSVLMKFLVPWVWIISPSSFLARCGQETSPTDFYLSQLLLHSQHSSVAPAQPVLTRYSHPKVLETMIYQSAPTDNKFWFISNYLASGCIYHSNNAILQKLEQI